MSKILNGRTLSGRDILAIRKITALGLQNSVTLFQARFLVDRILDEHSPDEFRLMTAQEKTDVRGRIAAKLAPYIRR